MAEEYRVPRIRDIPEGPPGVGGDTSQDFALVISNATQD